MIFKDWYFNNYRKKIAWHISIAILHVLKNNVYLAATYNCVTVSH